jgi:hypothetical protein
MTKLHTIMHSQIEISFCILISTFLFLFMITLNRAIQLIIAYFLNLCQSAIECLISSAKFDFTIESFAIKISQLFPETAATDDVLHLVFFMRAYFCYKQVFDILLLENSVDFLLSTCGSAVQVYMISI